MVVGNKSKVILLLLIQIVQLNFARCEQSCLESKNTGENISYRGVTLRTENDSFAKTDRNYSHGLVLTFESHDIKNFEPECFSWPIRLHSKIINFLTPKFLISDDNATKMNSLVVKLGQSIYTPKNAARRDLILNDRPYAGVLYIGLSLHQRYRPPETNLEMLDASEITLGMIGPSSLAKEFQDNAHDFFGDLRFQGWSHQLENEPALQIAIDKKFKTYQGAASQFSGFSVDLIRSIGARLGNIETSANFSIEGRVGWDIPNDFGSYTIRPGTDSRPPDLTRTQNEVASKNNSSHFGFHFFTIFDFKYVSYNYSVDGNLFSSSHHVTRQPFVIFSAFGFSFPTILRKRGYNFAIMQVYQTSDFKEQDAHHAYRSLLLGVDF